MSSSNGVMIGETEALIPGECVLPVCYIDGNLMISSDKPLTGTWEVQYRGPLPVSPSLDGVVFLLKRVK